MTKKIHLAAFSFIMAAALFTTLSAAKSTQTYKTDQIESTLHIGDVVFIRVSIPPFTKISQSTMSWTNHVGIVTATKPEVIISESRVPFSSEAKFSDFVSRSENGRVAITRAKKAITLDHEQKIQKAAKKRLGIYYDTGFSLESTGQFCSRYVHEVLNEGADISIGKVQTLKDLLAENPKGDTAFWKAWFFGNIPWDRKTITPASELRDSKMQVIFDGNLIK